MNILREFSRQFSIRARNSELGAYIVLFALLSFALFALIALVIGLGLVSTAGTRIDQVADLAAYAGIKGVLDSRQTPGTLPDDWGQAARNRANEVLTSNYLPGAADVLGGLDVAPNSGTGGQVIIGGYFFEDPDGTGPQNPCPSGYPCFSPYSSGVQDEVNAVRILLQNESTNPVIAPFGRFLGLENFQLSAASTAAVVRTCVAYLLDISGSSVLEKHKEARPANISGPTLNCSGVAVNSPPKRVACPDDQAMYAYRARILNPPGYSELDPSDPSEGTDWMDRCDSFNLTKYLSSEEPEILSWCSIAGVNASPVNENDGGPPRPRYRQFYVKRASPFGLLYIDARVTPEPLNSFYLAINAGLTLIEGRAAIGDNARVIPFTGRLRAPFPPDRQTESSEELSFLRQLTNLSNVAIQATPPAEIQPNPLTRGWIPIKREPGNFLDGQTDAMLAIQAAIDSLAQCSNSSRKAIVMLGDGLTNCALDASGNQSCPGARLWSIWQAVEDQMIGDGPGPGPHGETIVEQLIRNKISFSAVLRANYVDPNYRAEIDPATGKLLTPTEMYRRGRPLNYIFNSASYHPSPTPPATNDDPAEAFRDVGDADAPGVIFRQPNLLFGSLAVRTGGVFGPLLDLCVDTAGDCPSCSPDSACPGANACYECPDGDPTTPEELRPCALPTTWVTCAVTNESIAAQGARYIADAVGGNPFLIVE